MSLVKKKKVVGSGKRMRACNENAVKSPVAPADAVAALRKFKAPKFDQTINIVFHLGIDPKAADQALRGSIALPHGIGKSARVVAFCGPDKVAAAKAAGAIEAGADELVAKIEGGWMDFDVAVASPDMMRVASKLGKVLGPKGLMPSPKAGTVTPNVAEAVKEYAAGKQEYRNDDAGNVHGVIGKMSFSDDKLVDNLNAFVQAILKAKPSTAKGTYVKKCVVAGCMSPGVPVAV